jgi:hypothetical protein
VLRYYNRLYCGIHKLVSLGVPAYVPAPLAERLLEGRSMEELSRNELSSREWREMLHTSPHLIIVDHDARLDRAYS